MGGGANSRTTTLFGEHAVTASGSTGDQVIRSTAKGNNIGQLLALRPASDTTTQSGMASQPAQSVAPRLFSALSPDHDSATRYLRGGQLTSA